MCCFINVTDDNQAHQYFKLVNKNLPLKTFPGNRRLTIPKKIVLELQKRYPSVFTTSMNPQRPNINAQQLCDALMNSPIIIHNSEVNDEDLIGNVIQSIMALNEKYLKEVCEDVFKYPKDTVDRIRSLLKIAHKKSFILGMFKDFEFIQELV